MVDLQGQPILALSYRHLPTILTPTPPSTPPCFANCVNTPLVPVIHNLLKSTTSIMVYQGRAFEALSSLLDIESCRFHLSNSLSLPIFTNQHNTHRQSNVHSFGYFIVSLLHCSSVQARFFPAFHFVASSLSCVSSEPVVYFQT